MYSPAKTCQNLGGTLRLVVHRVLRVVLSLILRHAWISGHRDRAAQPIRAVVVARCHVTEEALNGGDAALLRRELGAVPSSHLRVYEPRTQARDCEAGVQTRLDDGVRGECGFGEAIPARTADYKLICGFRRGGMGTRCPNRGGRWRLRISLRIANRPTMAG